MKKLNQNHIVIKTGLSASFICEIFAGKKRPSWQNAKKIAKVTKTPVDVWLEGTPEEIQIAIKKATTQPNPLP